MSKPVDHIAAFVAALAADPQFGQFADGIEKLLQAVDLEADGNDHAAALFVAVDWVLAQPKPVRDKLDVLRRLFDLGGFVHIASIREFSGW